MAKRRRFAENAFRGLVQLEPVGVDGSIRVPIEFAAGYNAAGLQFRMFLYRRHLLGKLTAEDLTQIAHFHTTSGGCGLEDLAMDPSRHSGRHVIRHYHKCEIM
jgi:hypothetical protein